MSNILVDALVFLEEEYPKELRNTKEFLASVFLPVSMFTLALGTFLKSSTLALVAVIVVLMIMLLLVPAYLWEQRFTQDLWEAMNDEKQLTRHRPVMKQPNDTENPDKSHEEIERELE